VSSALQGQWRFLLLAKRGFTRAADLLLDDAAAGNPQLVGPDDARWR
jgi:hypothetical protein